MLTQVRVANPSAVSAQDGTVIDQLAGKSGESLYSQFHGKYYSQASRGNLFMAHAIVTAPVIYTTAAGTGGPLIWNGSTTHNVVLLAAGYGVTVVTTVAAALGITGAGGQTVAPTSTTAIDSTTNMLLGGAASRATSYRVGTPLAAGTFLLPFADVHTGALTTEPGSLHWIDLAGAIVCPPNRWVSLAASATATTAVAQLAIVWEEVPV